MLPKFWDCSGISLGSGDTEGVAQRSGLIKDRKGEGNGGDDVRGLGFFRLDNSFDERYRFNPFAGVLIVLRAARSSSDGKSSSTMLVSSVWSPLAC